MPPAPAPPMIGATGTASALLLIAFAPATGGPKPEYSGELLLTTGERTSAAQFETGCLPDPATAQIAGPTCVDGEPQALTATLVVGRGRQVEAALAQSARQVVVTLERHPGRDLRLRTRPRDAARDAFTFTMPARARSGDVLRVFVRYDPVGNALFFTRVRVRR